MAGYADAKYPGTGIIVDTSDLIRLQKTLETKVKRDLKVTVEEGIRHIAGFLHDRIRDNISIQHYTLTELKDLGHPYSRKNFPGSGLSGTGNKYLISSHGKIAGLEPYIVNRQSGTLLSSLRWEIDKTSDEIIALVGLSSAAPEHARYVLMGTRYMVSRDFLAYALYEHREEMIEKFQRMTGLKHR